LQQFDLILIGAGVSGLSLINQLAKTSSMNVLLIGPKDLRQQTISFWQRENVSEWYSEFIIKAWSKWSIQHQQSRCTHHSNRYVYRSIDGLKLKKITEDKILLAENITRLYQKANDIEKVHGGFKVVSEGSIFFGKNVIDTRHGSSQDNLLKQHFLGIRVSLPKPYQFNDTIMLMDFDIQKPKEVGFIYVLPFTNSDILIEATFFSKQLFEKDIYYSMIQDWMTKTLNISMNDCEILFEEYGNIPMHEVKYTNQAVQKLGLSGNAMRLSTGYAFLGIQEQVKSIISNVHTKNDLKVKTPYAPWVKWFDLLFLKVLQNYPQKMPYAFFKMMRLMRSDDFVDFLLGYFNLRAVMRAIQAMPKRIFILNMMSR
tara:strand:- start:2032 stop:3141 length:1110 start_codon:yes stop_codon:yes gene_type:complete